MAKPIILTGDDEPQVLNAVERDLRRHYRGKYRILKAGAGEGALQTVRQLKQRNDPLALFLVDQRMPSMSGTEFLAEARKLYSEARRVLLTAYADYEAANYRGQHIVVVGGANSAGQGAIFISQYASKVTMLVRASELEKGMSQYLADQICGTGNIEVLTRTEVVEATGRERLEAVTILNKETGKTQTLPAAAMFIFIGAAPHSELVAGVVERNKTGFSITGQDLIREGRRPKRWSRLSDRAQSPSVSSVNT